MAEEYDEVEEAAGPEEALRIADFFISNAPAGEVDLVVADVKVLTNRESEVLDAAKTEEFLGKYNVNRMEWATAPDSQEPVIVASAGQVASNQFVNPGTGNVLEFNHTTRTFSMGDSKQSLPENIEAYRSAIARSVREYVQANFTDGKCVTTTFGSDAGIITVCLSAKNVNLGNFWTGAWRSTYTLDVSSEGSANLECSVRVDSHYFEDGNVQLVSDKKSSVAIDVKDAKSTAHRVATAVGEFETNFQNALEEMYVNMHLTTFKQMRRIATLSGNFMTWNLAAHNVARTVGTGG
jgi:capping protein alpha